MAIVDPSGFAPADNTLLGLLAASSGSSLVGFIQSGTGAVASTEQTELRYFIRPEQFGALGDDSTDDTTAINNAVTRLADGGTLVLDAKIYRHSGGLNPGNKNIRIIGTGWSAYDFHAAFGNAGWSGSTNLKGSLIRITGTASAGVIFDPTVVGKICFEDMALVGPGSGATAGISIGPSARATESNIFKNVGIFNFSTGLLTNSMLDSSLIHPDVRGCTTGISLTNASNQNNLFNPLVQTCGTGINISTVDTVNVHGGLIQSCTTDGLLVTDANVCQFNGIHFENYGTLSGYDIRIETTGSTSNLGFSGNRITQPGNVTGGVLINGGTASTFIQNRGLAGRFTIAAAAANTLLLWNNISAMAYTNNGTDTVRLDYSSTSLPLPAGSAALPTYSFAGIPTTGLYNPSSNIIAMSVTAFARSMWSGSAYIMRSDGQIGFSNNTDPTAGTLDTILARDAANTLAIKNANSDQLFRSYGANGGYWERGSASELLTLSTGGATTDTSGNLLPSDSIIESVVARVTTTITTATDWKLGDATISGRFAAANATMTAGATSVGTVHADQTGTSGPRQVAAAKVRVTTTGTPGAGVIRIIVFYRKFIAPTS